ncbi:hypothetical protein HMPREF1115_1172 [Streptococcus oralis SK610]|uniref:Uncharacterized protein n=1 Tax=Streptococcus oralis SK610 TaxID=1095741 RepID=I0Q4Y3_STROR|nr:hypothetical protein HMPREF1115_1172 [Streptococcus oralis SK610]
MKMLNSTLLNDHIEKYSDNLVWAFLILELLNVFQNGK